MLILSKILGAPIENYLEQTHVEQQRILEILEFGIDVPKNSSHISNIHFFYLENQFFQIA